jgi:hypothetical protein
MRFIGRGMMTDYAKRLDKCRDKWRWMRGMVDTEGWIFIREHTFFEIHGVWTDKGGTELIYDNANPRYPDLTDPATKGCLIAQIRETHPEFCIVPVQYGSETILYTIYYWLGDERGQFDTEEDAILAAIESLEATDAH